jgi:protein involved in polysaccharide export with SLBB domain
MLILILLLSQAQVYQSGPEDAGRELRPSPEGSQLVFEGIMAKVDRDSYRLGPGDVLTITYQGGCTSYMMASGATPVSSITVTSDQMVAVPGVGQLEVGGMTVGEAEDSLALMAEDVFPEAVLRLALAEPRSLRVAARGMISRPGTYVLTAVNRVSDLVEMAGGLSVYGSRRGVMRTSEGDSVSFNLVFDPQTMERASDPYLVDEAVVVFPLIEDPVYLVRQGLAPIERSSVETWGLPDSTDLSEFLGYTGGLSGDVDLAHSVLLRGDSSYSVWGPQSGVSDRLLQPGDTLRLVMMSDSLVIGGAVSTPGPVQYVPGWTVREYISLAGGFKPDASESSVRVLREGRVVRDGDGALEYPPRPGDVIEVPYTWISKNASILSVVSASLGVVSILFNIFGGN